ncbi:hypothetical protein T05_1399 [Trichinella murrelli]|uniref:Uncharacterized protein n=1 Tax=Trichinella murrelli TaxID=144512 RepID=A0A0V0SZ54_9BILA|nr:hypothetical protein T05_1399 [Trichinella murrelli]
MALHGSGTPNITFRPDGEDLKTEADDSDAEPWQKPEHSPPHAKENTEDRNTEEQSEPYATPQTLRTSENPEIHRRRRLNRTTTRRDCARRTDHNWTSERGTTHPQKQGP